jgi:predicted AlkP superfamily phosphohydrolase/phosphomutase
MKLDRALAVAALCLLAAAVVVGVVKWRGAPTREAAPRRAAAPGSASLLVVGLEGLEPRVYESLIAEGSLPNLSRLISAGAVVTFPSFPRGIDSRVTWTSLVTGVTPERQGVGALVRSPKGNMVPLPLTPASRTVDTIWSLLSEADRRVAVLGWPCTWPVERVNGLMVGPYETYVLDRAHGGKPEEAVYPPDAYAAVDSLIRTAESYRRISLSRFVSLESALGLEALAGYNLEVLTKSCAADTTLLNLAQFAVARQGASALFVFLPGLDGMSQRFWVYMEPVDPPRLAADPRALAHYRQLVEASGGTLRAYYEYLDEMLGALVDLVGDGGTVAVVSDHGYAGLKLDERGDPGIGVKMHSEAGLLILVGPGVRPGARVERATLLDVAPTVMAAAGIDAPAGLDGRALKEVLR